MCKNLFKRSVIFCGLFFNSGAILWAQQTPVQPVLWHNKERRLNYHPDGTDIVCFNGKHRFNRAIYGTNTAFRVEAGDLPEFAMYLPGMGGNLKFGLIHNGKSKWLIDADSIEARYRPGSMIYTIHDADLGKGILTITILAGASTESMIVKTEFRDVTTLPTLFWAFGGVTGKKFSRDGDLGADPESSFYLKPEYCKNNSFQLSDNSFALTFTGVAASEADRYEIKQPGIKADIPPPTADQKRMSGTFPAGAQLQLADANKQGSPAELLASKPGDAPVLTGKIEVANSTPLYFLIQSPAEATILPYGQLAAQFADAEIARQKIANRVIINTPDPFINTLGGVLSIAADAIWESPSYMHGAIAWRMRLNAWRGPYIADVLGWHDRARSHFSSYALSQVTTPLTGPNVPDTALHLAREQEKMGNAMFSSGYISRNPGGKPIPHHYDMNLVFIDELLNHFNWTGDRDYVKQMWPVLTRHLAWEKRNFDADGDGLYDAYCVIWASDALQYSGGGVTHSSAYNYRANRDAARLARLIGMDAAPYQKEADHILNSINKTLWLPQTGQYAEFQDLLGNKLIHPAAGLWTVYHTIDSEVPDNFQAYQALRYVDTQIPHIPIIAKGIPDGLYTLSTTNWMPYDWSLNNVVLAEELHTSLAYWQGNRPENAFTLWKSSLMESQFLESSPGNFENMSFYDANRGELYRDFGDPIGMTGRSLIEGLFGIHPDGLTDSLTIHPGLPSAWDHASIKTPDVAFDYKRQSNTDAYTIVPSFLTKMNLNFLVNAKAAGVKAITVNGIPVVWKIQSQAVDLPQIQINAGKAARYDINIVWDSTPIEKVSPVKVYSAGNAFHYSFDKAGIVGVYDPQGVLKGIKHDANTLDGTIIAANGSHTLFVNLKQGDLSWWAPINIEIKPAFGVLASEQQQPNTLKFKIAAITGDVNAKVVVNKGPNAFTTQVSVKAGEVSPEISVPAANIILGSNTVEIINSNGASLTENVVNWNIQKQPSAQEIIDLSSYFNDKVTNIFKNKYLSPRPTSPTLQLPWQGIGNWCYPLVEADIDDSGLRKAAGAKNEFTTPQGLSFATPSKADTKNIVFTSQWDNYPKQVVLPLSGQASHAYFMMAGSTNPMQSQLVNGEVIITYTDNSADTLSLRNPETWWPIEQDYLDDGFAFRLNAARPIRVYLKDGIAATEWNKFKGIKGYAGRGVDGGAGTILDLPLHENETLKSLTLKTIANDVVIGLMGLTLVRE